MEKKKKVATAVAEYQEMTNDDLAKLSPGKLFGEAVVTYPNPEDPENVLTSTFTVFDGIAYSTVEADGRKREVVATFPLLRFINTTAKTMKENIKTALNITEDRDITPVEILQTYCNISFVGD